MLFFQEDEDEEEEEPDEEDYIVEGAAKWKEKAAKRATENFMTRQLDAVNLHSVRFPFLFANSDQIWLKKFS